MSSFLMLKIMTLQDPDISLSYSACSSVIKNECKGVEGERVAEVLFIFYYIVALPWKSEAIISKEKYK